MPPSQWPWCAFKVPGSTQQNALAHAILLAFLPQAYFLFPPTVLIADLNSSWKRGKREGLNAAGRWLAVLLEFFKTHTHKIDFMSLLQWGLYWPKKTKSKRFQAAKQNKLRSPTCSVFFFEVRTEHFCKAQVLSPSVATPRSKEGHTYFLNSI